MGSPSFRFRPRFLVWAACVAVTCACATATLPKEDLQSRKLDWRTHDITTSTALRIIIDESHHGPYVGVALISSGGSAKDPVGREGLAALTQKATLLSRASNLTVKERLIRLGATDVKAHLELDYAAYTATVRREDVPALLKIYGDWLAAPLNNVDDSAFEDARALAVSDLFYRIDSSGRAIGDRLRAVSFPPGHPYARPQYGTEATLAAITLDDVKKAASTYLHPSELTLVLSGDVDRAFVEQALKDGFSRRLLGNGYPLVPPPRAGDEQDPPLGGSPDVVTMTSDVDSPYLYATWTIPRALGAGSHKTAIHLAAARAALINTDAKHPDIVGTSLWVERGVSSSLLVARFKLTPTAKVPEVVEEIFERLEDGGRPDYRDLIRLTRGTKSLVQSAVAKGSNAHFQQRHNPANAGAPAAKPDPDVERTRWVNRERTRFLLVSPGAVAGPPKLQIQAPISELDGEEAWPSAEEVVRRAPGPGLASFHRVTLENGLEVIIGARSHVPFVSVGLSFRGGNSAAEPGVALLARVLLRRGSAEQLIRIPGGTDEVEFLDDETRYRYFGSDGNLVNYLAALAADARGSDIHAEIAPVVTELFLNDAQHFDEDRSAILVRSVTGVLLEGTPYGRPVTMADVRRATGSQASEWLERTHQPHNATLVIVGNVDVAATEKLVRDWFGDWRGDPKLRPDRPAPQPGRGARTLLFDEKTGEQAVVNFACRLPSSDPKAVLHAEVLARVLQRRMETALRSSRGPAYVFPSFVNQYGAHTATLWISGLLDAPALGSATQTLSKTLADVAGGTVTTAELEPVRWTVARARATAYASNTDVVINVLQARAYGWPMEALDEVPSILASVTPAEVAEVARACIASGPVMALHGERAAIEPVQTQFVLPASP